MTIHEKRVNISKQFTVTIHADRLFLLHSSSKNTGRVFLKISLVNSIMHTTYNKINQMLAFAHCGVGRRALETIKVRVCRVRERWTRRADGSRSWLPQARTTQT